MKNTFRSLKQYNYRTWAIGALISNIGTWMQRTAQDWLVLTELTHHNATAVGIIMSLQFGPQILLLPVTGLAADHFDRRKLLFVTQTASGLLALALGVLTLTGSVRLGHVYLLALLLGCVSSFDTPARQAFVSDLVGEADLPNAVALNSTSFNAASMLGPAVAGFIIHVFGVGWAFLINAASFLAVLASLLMLRQETLHASARPPRTGGQLLEGFRYVASRPDLKLALLMMFLISTFGINFPIFIATMDVAAFHAGAREYGVLTSVMAIGSVIGALLSASRTRLSLNILLIAALGFGATMALAAIMPNLTGFGFALIGVGIATQTFTTSTNSLVQLSSEPAMRGRVVAILFAITMGCTPLGAPLVGWVADQYGPRIALAVGATSGLLAAFAAWIYLSGRNSKMSR